MTGSLVSRAGPESPCHVVVHINATAQVDAAAAHCALVLPLLQFCFDSKMHGEHPLVAG